MESASHGRSRNPFRLYPSLIGQAWPALRFVRPPASFEPAYPNEAIA
jgi:hypothetical protein